MIINMNGGGGSSYAELTVSVGVAGATVTASYSGGSSITGTTNSSGVVTLSVPPGYDYTITASKTNYFINSTTKHVDAGSTSVTLSISAYPVVTITLTDTSGASVASRVINGTGAASVTATTNSSGVATFMLSTVGSYVFVVAPSSIPEGGSTSTYSVTVAAGGTYSGALEISYGFSGYVGCVIEESTSSPSGRVSYPENISTGSGTYPNLAYGATPMSGAGGSFSIGSWGTGQLAKFIEGIKPVSFNGTTWTDLNKTDETSWPSTQGTDCFTEFPFRWLSITKSGTQIRIIFASGDTAPDSTFQDWAFLGADGTTRRPNFHLGCYTASGSTSAVYSQKGSSNLVSTALNKYWVAASKRGSEYDCLPFAMWTYIQALFVVLYRSTDSQTAHSKGYVGGSSVQSNTAFTSYSNDYGMYGTTANTTTQMAFFWLHNLWGNMYQFIASVFTRAGSSYTLYYILSAMSRSSNWNNSSWDSTSNYAKQASLGTSSDSTGWSSSGYFTKACGSNGAGFIASSDAGSGSSTTYYSDYGYVYVDSSRASFPIVGGYYYGGDGAGLFYAYVNRSSTYSDTYYGSRLAYRGGRA